MELQTKNRELVQETKDLGLLKVYRNNLRNQLGHIMDWWKINYADHYDANPAKGLHVFDNGSILQCTLKCPPSPSTTDRHEVV
jgi:hypothetical protein